MLVILEALCSKIEHMGLLRLDVVPCGKGLLLLVFVLTSGVSRSEWRSVLELQLATAQCSELPSSSAHASLPQISMEAHKGHNQEDGSFVSGAISTSILVWMGVGPTF